MDRFDKKIIQSTKQLEKVLRQLEYFRNKDRKSNIDKKERNIIHD